MSAGATSAERLSRDSRLLVEVIGGCSVNGQRGQVAIRNRKARAMLGYLAMTPSQSETRERLAGLLWSDSGEDQARASLRQCLKQLREALGAAGFDGLRSERETVSLTGDAVRLDLDEAVAALRSDRPLSRPWSTPVNPKLILYGFEGLDQSFDAWLYVVRQRWQDHITGLLEQTLREATPGEPLGRWSSEALLAIDATHEEAHRHLIATFAAAGNLGAALRQYNALWQLLEDEYDMEPAEETQALIARIKLGPVAAPPLPDIAAAASPYPAAGASADGAGATWTGLDCRRLVLVGRFSVDGVDPKRHYVVNGFRQSLIAGLVRFRDWIVAEGSGGGAAGGPSVRYLIDAGAFEIDGAIELVLTLREDGTGEYIWSDRYSIGLERWVEAQRLIVRRIAVALNVHISAERLSRIAADRTLPNAIYDRWLRGQDLYLRWRPKDSNRATEIFRSIIDDAPAFAPAYSSLVQILNSRHIIFPGIYRTPQRHSEALALAETAVRLDPIDSKTHLCLAWSYALNRRFDQADLRFELAHDLNENDPWTLVSSAHGLAFCGRRDAAIARAEQAMSLRLDSSPIHWAYQAGIRFLCEDYAGCVAAADLAQDAIYDLGGWKTAALTHLGERDRAVAEGRRFVELIAGNWHGAGTATASAVAAWVLHAFPFRDERDRERLGDGLRGAGIAVGDPAGPAARPLQTA